MLDIHRGGQVASFDKLMATCDHEALKRLLVDLDEGNRLKSSTPPETRVQALVERLRQMAWEQIVDRTERKMRQQELDPAQQEEALLWLIRRRSAEGSGGSGGSGTSDGTGNAG